MRVHMTSRPSPWQRFRALARHAGLLAAARVALGKVCARWIAPTASLHFGQTGEDTILKWLTTEHIGPRPVTYVEVGCHDARACSTSYRLYIEGGRGLAIDLEPSHAASFRAHRPRDVFVAAAVSDVEGDAVAHAFETSLVTTINATQAEAWAHRWKPTGQYTVRTKRLWDLYEAHLAPAEVDVLLLDVEGHEEAVLRGARLERMRPRIIVCEMHGLDLARPLESGVARLLVDAGYRLVAYATMNGYWLRAPGTPAGA